MQAVILLQVILRTTRLWMQLLDNVTEKKLGLLGGLEDPYLHSERIISEDWQNWPAVEYPDVYNFLIQTPSLYTGESLKAYKSLDAYNHAVHQWMD